MTIVSTSTAATEDTARKHIAEASAHLREKEDIVSERRERASSGARGEECVRGGTSNHNPIDYKIYLFGVTFAAVTLAHRSARMFAQRVAARQGTAAERVSLIGDDRASPSLARPRRAAGASPPQSSRSRSGRAPSSRWSPRAAPPEVRARFALGQATASEIPEGIGLVGDNGMTTVTACDQKETFCELTLWNDSMNRCCLLSNDAATQQDCLCNPMDYGFEESETDNVGVVLDGGVTAALGEASRKLGLFRNKPTSVAKLGVFRARVRCRGTATTSTEMTMYGVCCSAFPNATEANACLCDPISFV